MAQTALIRNHKQTLTLKKTPTFSRWNIINYFLNNGLGIGSCLVGFCIEEDTTFAFLLLRNRNALGTERTCHPKMAGNLSHATM